MTEILAIRQLVCEECRQEGFYCEEDNEFGYVLRCYCGACLKSGCKTAVKYKIFWLKWSNHFHISMSSEAVYLHCFPSSFSICTSLPSLS